MNAEEMGFWGRIKISSLNRKPGGLDSHDQSRSRSRFLDLSRPTFETCRDCPYCRDKIIFCLGQDFWIKTWPGRDFHQDCRDKSRLLIFFEICWDFSRFIKISQHYQDFLKDFRLKNVNKLKNLDWEKW